VKIRYQADASLKLAIVRGLIRVEAALDFRTAAEARLEGLGDLEVLAAATQDGRILVTHEIRTMPGHFAEHLKTHGTSPGVFLVPQRLPIGVAIEELPLLWLSTDAEDWKNRIVWLPL
jgi:hypothetical protein